MKSTKPIQVTDVIVVKAGKIMMKILMELMLEPPPEKPEEEPKKVVKEK